MEMNRFKISKRLIFLPLALVWIAPAFAQAPKPEKNTAQGKLAAGTEWETGYYLIDSGIKGPTVLIVGGMHGNEPAGSWAAEQIRHWPIAAGKLIVIPRANVLALKANTRLTPGQPEEAGNLNRNFPSGSKAQEKIVTPRGKLAMALWKFAGKIQPDWVIDLHEGYDFNISHQPPKEKKKSVGSSVIYEGGEKMDALANEIIAAANATVTDPKKQFSRISRGPVDTGLAQACIQVLGAEALILETTYKNQPPSLRTRQHRAMVNVLLNHIGLIDRDCRDILAAPKSPGHLLVGKFDGPGTRAAAPGSTGADLAGIITEAEDMTVHFLGAAEVRPEVLQQFDVLLFPGGSGSKQARAIGEKGRASVRDFVRSGGGYIGVCAGAYLCSAHYSWSLDLIDSAVFTGSREIPGKGKKQMWYRGKWADIDIELTESGEKLFPEVGREFVVCYSNGPIISPKGMENLEDYEVLAWFRSENGLWEPQKGTMINTPAIVSGKFGKGRVMSVSPHPETTEALHSIIENSIRWVGEKEKKETADGR